MPFFNGCIASKNYAVMSRSSSSVVAAAAAAPAPAGPSASASASAALHSLVEAATALTQLVSAPPVSASGSAQNDSAGTSFVAAAAATAANVAGRKIGPHCVSEDEMTTACAASVASSAASSSLAPVIVTKPSPPPAIVRHAITPPPSPPRKGRKGSAKKSKSKRAHKKKPSSSSSSLSKHSKKNKSKSSSGVAAGKAPRTRPDIFPQRLLRVLSDPAVRQIITWLPHGRSFVILRPDLFADSVLPAHFPESKSKCGSSSKSSKSVSKYSSFTRKLNRWGFRQINKGPESGAFSHELFRRDEPHLCMSMECQKSGGGASKTKGFDNASLRRKTVSSPQHSEDDAERTATSLTVPGRRPSFPPLKKRKLMSPPTSDTTATHIAAATSPAPLLPLPSEITFASASDGTGRLPPPPRTAEHARAEAAVSVASLQPRPQQPLDTTLAPAPPVQQPPLPFTAAAAEDAARRTREALRALDSLRQLMAAKQAAVGALAPSATVPRHCYEPSLHLPQNGGSNDASAIPTQAEPQRGQVQEVQVQPMQLQQHVPAAVPVADPAAAAEAAAQHKSALYRAYIQALSS